MATKSDPREILEALRDPVANQQVTAADIIKTIRGADDDTVRQQLRMALGGPVDVEQREKLMEKARQNPDKIQELDRQLAEDYPLTAIASTDIVTRLSGGNANTNPNASLGGIISATAWTGGTLHDLFDLITGDENAASDVEYRGIYVLNNHATQTWYAPTVWISAETAGGAVFAIGLDPAGVGNGSTTGVMATIADENTAPASVTFSAPTTKASGLVSADIPAANARGIWFRRSAANTAALSNDSATVSVEGDTDA